MEFGILSVIANRDSWLVQCFQHGSEAIARFRLEGCKVKKRFPSVAGARIFVTGMVLEIGCKPLVLWGLRRLRGKPRTKLVFFAAFSSGFQAAEPVFRFLFAPASLARSRIKIFFHFCCFGGLTNGAAYAILCVGSVEPNRSTR